MQDLTRKHLIYKWQDVAAKVSAHARELTDEAIRLRRAECKQAHLAHPYITSDRQYYEIRAAHQQRYAATIYAYVRHLMGIDQ